MGGRLPLVVVVYKSEIKSRSDRGKGKGTNEQNDDNKILTTIIDTEPLPSFSVMLTNQCQQDKRARALPKVLTHLLCSSKKVISILSQFLFRLRQ